MKLLAPAGNWQAFVAAFANGADAVYLGGKSYSARQSAENFSIEEIGNALEIAHLYQKKILVTVNTLIGDRELNALLDYIYELYTMGVDAIIVQDIGLIHYLRKALPDLTLHASTQMTIHNSWGAKLLQEMGIHRVVLARELSLADIKKIAGSNEGLELEVFAHGALCYSYSGQCLFSSMIGGRSGNRGRCAQPCRLSYQVIDDDHKKLDKPAAHLFSMADLCLIDKLKELETAGVSWLKIEGRMKRPEYVAVVTQAYRKALDAALAGKNQDNAKLRKELAQIFNRNFTSGYIDGMSDNLLSVTKPSNRGNYIGRVVGFTDNGATLIKLKEELHVGDGIEVWVRRGPGPAFSVDKISINDKCVDKALAGETIALEIDGRVSIQDRVFKTHDSILIAKAQKSFNWLQENKFPLEFQVKLERNQPMQLSAYYDDTQSVTCFTKTNAVPATNQPLTNQILFDKLSRLGNTQFYLAKLDIMCDEELMIPISEINAVRREAIDKIIVAQTNGSQTRVIKNLTKEPLLEIIFPRKNKAAPKTKKTELTIAVSDIQNAGYALEKQIDQVYFYINGLMTRKLAGKKQLEEILAIEKKSSGRLIPALPSIQKDQDWKFAKILLEELGNREVMVANWGALKWCLDHGIKAIADYPLNIYNSLALEYLKELGITKVCLSPELNFNQIMDINKSLPIEIIVHGELRLMVSECCSIRVAMGENSDNCNRVCENKVFYYEDGKRFRFPVISDHYCRNYVFNSKPICLIDQLEQVRKVQPDSIRIESLLNSKKEIDNIIASYRYVWENLNSENKISEQKIESIRAEMVGNNFTRGHFFRGVQ